MAITSSCPWLETKQATIPKSVYDSALKDDGNVIQYIKKPNMRQRRQAIKTNCHSIQHLDKQTEKDCLLAASIDGMVLPYLRVKTRAVYIKALNNTYKAIMYVDKDSPLYEEMCIRAIKINYRALGNILYPSPAAIKLALNINSDAINYINTFSTLS